MPLPQHSEDSMIDWPAELDRHVRRIAGPEDEFDDETNGDPDSLLGEEDASGFDDGSNEPEPLFTEDDGFDDAAGEEEDDGEEEGMAEEGDDA